MSMPDWGSLLQGFTQDPLGSLGQLGQNAWQYTPQVAGQALNSLYPGAGVPYGAAQAGYYGLTNPGQNLMPGGQQPQAQYGTQAQQPPQQPYNYGTNAGPNAYGYGSAPSAAGTTGQAGGTAGTGQTGTPYAGSGAATGQQAGAFPGTGAASTPTAPLGTGTTARSFVDPANAFNDPETAVTQAMIELGINPLRGGPAVATVLSQAKDLVNTLMLNAVNTGNDLMATPNGFADALRGQVQKALQGGGVFYGPGQAGAAALQQARDILAGMGQGPGTSGLGSVLASQMQNASSAANMMQSLLYAGGNPAGRQAVSAWTQMVPLIMGQMLNQNPQTFAPNQYGNAPTALDVLQQILSYKAPQASGLAPALQQAALPTGQ